MLLKIGSKGKDVKKIQEKLKLKTDGKFGDDTFAAVKKWQSENGLEPDGLVGEIDWYIMFRNEVSSVKGLNLNKLKGNIPDIVLSQIPETAKKFKITTNLRLAHFLSQCAHESGGFKAVSENLNYSVEGLKDIFGKYFPGNLSESYARQPQKIGNRVYADRMGNGSESSGEGFKFRGRGYIQLTGKSNYTKFGKFIGEDTIGNPDLVANKFPLASAAFFFDSNDIWETCDKGSNESTITSVTRRINGGTNGLEDRIKYFNKYYKLLS
jgi:putative chitinase